MPPYYTLVLRSLASLEGLAVAADENFKTFQAAYPYVVRKLLSDNSLATRRLLNQVSFIISFRAVCAELASEVGVVLGPSMGPCCLQSISWTNITMLCCPPCGLGCINVITNTNQFTYTGNFQQKERVPMAEGCRISEVSFSEVCFIVLTI